MPFKSSIKSAFASKKSEKPSSWSLPTSSVSKPQKAAPTKLKGMNTIQGAWNTLSGNEHAQAASAMVEQDSSAFKFLDLTKTQRLYGFGFCLVAGFGLSLVGSIFFAFGDIALFATLYTVGVVISLIGTGFLIGFTRQVKMAWDPVRRYAAGIFLLCIILVFVFAFALPIDVLVIVFAVCTFLSYAWYSLSFIPYARDIMIKLWPF